MAGKYGNWPEILAALGGFLAIVGGMSSALLGKAFIQIITGWEIAPGPLLLYLGITGILGGLVTFYGLAKDSRKVVILGGILGLFAPSLPSLLAVIGGLLMK